jgi:hypothetical protein
MTDEDLADIVLRKWSAQQRILQRARRTVERYGLDPALLEDLRQAYLDGDDDGFLEANAVLWECWMIAAGKA